MSFRTERPEIAQSVLDFGIEHGINFIDTADLYEKGKNESLIGELIKGKRNELILATKVGNQWREDGSGWDWVASKSYILEAVDNSLKRLQTDYIDLYQLHGGTIEDPMDEIIEAFEQLVDAGKIRAYGISSIRPNTIRLFSDKGNPVSVMMQYSILDRRPEEEVLDYLKQQNVGVLARGVLAKGLLAGKAASVYLNHSDEQVTGIIQKLKRGGNLSSLALSFVLKEPAISSAVLGFSSLDQIQQILDAYKEAINLEFPSDLMLKLPQNYYDQHR
jgi:aryl-alcohol dehydrogenase-like predicted oxidoreductase